jgi:hypothetical protein
VLVALLALLGVPIWLLVGMIGAAVWSRRNFARTPGVFKAKVRRVGGDISGVPDSWPRRAAYARWVHDVLLVHHGVALVRNIPLPVADRDARVEPVDGEAVKGLGDAPRVATFRLDSGAVAQIACAGADADLLSGPFPARP